MQPIRFVALSVLLLVVACGGGEPTPEPTPAPPVAETPPAETAGTTAAELELAPNQRQPFDGVTTGGQPTAEHCNCVLPDGHKALPLKRSRLSVRRPNDTVLELFSVPLANRAARQAGVDRCPAAVIGITESKSGSTSLQNTRLYGASPIPRSNSRNPRSQDRWTT